MTLDLDALEKTARAATPGKWKTERNAWGLAVIAPEVGGEYVPVFIETYGLTYAVRDADAEHVAAFDRETALALIAEIRNLREALEDYSREYPKECNKRVRAENERDVLRAEVQTLRQANAETDRGREEIKTRARKAIAERDALQAELDKVRKLHRRTHNRRTWCCHHDGHMWPCPTIKAIGEVDEH